MDYTDWEDWPKGERESQGLCISGLAKKAGIIRQVIYDYWMYDRTKPNAELLCTNSVAPGFPFHFLLIKAGILPPNPNIDEDLTKISKLYNLFTNHESNKRAEDYLGLLLPHEEGLGEYRSLKTIFLGDPQ